MSHRTAGRLAWGSGPIALLCMGLGNAIGLPAENWEPEKVAANAMFLVLLIVFASVGALIASRHPRNLIGWIFCGVAVAIGIGGLAHGYSSHWLAGRPASQSLGETAAWYANVSYALEIFIPIIFLPLLFPNGRLFSRRWLPAALCGSLGIVLYMASEMLTPGPLRGFAEVQNPYGVDVAVVKALGPVATMLLMFALLSAPASLVVRFRHSGHMQRQQIKWLVWAGAVAAATVLILLTPVDELMGRFVTIVALALSVLGLPLAAGVAILRYRLYEIDVVINRTLVYGALTATLAGTYLGSVLLLQFILNAFTTGDGLSVAVSTLTVAALFQPARGRIQGTVDRRFYRRHYDAQRTLEHFGTRLRDEVDVVALGGELRSVVSDTMQPTHVTLWLRKPGRGR